MLAIATQREPKFHICDFELRAESTFTLDTLRALRRRYGPPVRFYFIAGGDVLRDFHKWHRFESLLDEFHMVFVTRPETGARSFPAGVNPRVAAHVRWYDSSEAPWSQGSYLIDVGAPNISSTEIRRPVGSTKMKKWLTAEVYQYIRKYKLYEKR
jgi:nicotinate-nucleotide adenylyltransferase